MASTSSVRTIVNEETNAVLLCVTCSPMPLLSPPGLFASRHVLPSRVAAAASKDHKAVQRRCCSSGAPAWSTGKLCRWFTQEHQGWCQAGGGARRQQILCLPESLSLWVADSGNEGRGCSHYQLSIALCVSDASHKQVLATSPTCPPHAGSAIPKPRAGRDTIWVLGVGGKL